MHRLVRNSLLTIVALLCVGLIVSGTGLKLPAFARSSSAAQDHPAPIVAEDYADDSARDFSPGLGIGRNVIIQTDRSDYLPGELIIVTGSGWDPGETVTLLLHGGPTTHADRKVSVVADAFGNIFDNQFR